MSPRSHKGLVRAGFLAAEFPDRTTRRRGRPSFRLRLPAHPAQLVLPAHQLRKRPPISRKERAPYIPKAPIIFSGHGKSNGMLLHIMNPKKRDACRPTPAGAPVHDLLMGACGV